MFFDAPIQVLVGIGIGGLGASIAGTIFVLHQAEVINAMDFLDQFKKKDEASDEINSVASGFQVGSFNFPIPFPLITVLGWGLVLSFTLGFAFLRAKYQLRYREYLHQVNFSLTTLGKDNTLRLRTLLELPIETVIGGNQLAANMIVDGARSLSSETSFVPLPTRESDLIMNQILNCISPQFSPGYLAEDMGLPVKTEWFYFGITYHADAIRVRKLRVILASEDLLKSLLNETLPTPILESEDHLTRWNTLHEMAKLAKSQGFDGPAIVRKREDCDCVVRLGKLRVSIPT